MILQVDKVSKSFGKESVLHNISFSIKKSQIVALVGPNGSGKSTLFNIITNLLKADKGQVSIVGKPNTDPNIFKEISFMQDNSVLYDFLTGFDHLQFIAEVQNLPKESILEVAETIGNKDYLNKKVKNYSLGMKQHLLLSMALINKPKLLLLDEPLNGLDPTSAIRIRELLIKLQQKGTTIFLSSHNLAEIDQVTSDILFLKDGRLIEENLSTFEKTVYFIEMDELLASENDVKKTFPKVSTEGNRLTFSTKDHSLHDILSYINKENIQVIDIEKKQLGSEDRYREIFDQEEQKNESVKI